MKKIAIFASGTGSNARNIIRYFQDNEEISVALVMSNRSKAHVLKVQDEFGVPTMVCKRTKFYETTDLLNDLAAHDIDFIVLAGFLWLIPSYLVTAFPNKIINIHPALLPKYGGKGMYGKHVHEAVYAAKETETGITIHYVNEKYDEGQIVFQAKTTLTTDDTPDTIAKKVHQLEYLHFPKVIEGLLIDQ